MQFVSRAYNSFSLNKKKGSVIKTSSTERLEDEINYYHSLIPLSSNVNFLFPRMLASGFDDKKQNYFLELEYYPYKNLGYYLLNPHSVLFDNFWTNVCISLKEIFNELHENNKDVVNIDNDCKLMYVEKTLNEYQNLLTNFDVFNQISKNKSIEINGKQYLTFGPLWNLIEEKVKALLCENRNELTIMHGDMCFSNILAYPEKDFCILKLIDPRGSFGELTPPYGDKLYDYAKLLHSTDVGYEFFINDKFYVINQANKNFTLSFQENILEKHKQTVNKLFHDVLYSQIDLKKIKLIQALIYIGMCARHGDSQDRQLAMFLSGIKCLNEIIEDL